MCYMVLLPVISWVVHACANTSYQATFFVPIDHVSGERQPSINCLQYMDSQVFLEMDVHAQVANTRLLLSFWSSLSTSPTQKQQLCASEPLLFSTGTRRPDLPVIPHH